MEPSGLAAGPDVYELLRQLGAVILVLGLLYGLVRNFRRPDRFRQDRQPSWMDFLPGPLRRLATRWPRCSTGAPEDAPGLLLLDRLSLTPQHSVHLVRTGQQLLILATSPQGCALLKSTRLRRDYGQASAHAPSSEPVGVAFQPSSKSKTASAAA